MVTPTSLGTGSVPLKLAGIISKLANREWDDGSFLEKVSPVTKDLLKYWFYDSFCVRKFNFHEGQRQAILNAIYMHEIVGAKNVMDMYMSANPELLQEMDMLDLKREKYDHPKYAIKMATGTGKTWVLNALLIWQYLNAKHEDNPSGRFSKNFLLVAPGIIVYERLLDAYLGKEQEDGSRDFAESDFSKYRELFIPPAYKDEIFGFIQSGVARKDEIGRKVTGDGLIAITNWHLLAGVEEEEDLSTPLDDPSHIARDVMPISPGTTAGHDLNSLDSRYFSGKEIEFLSELSDIVVFNDEAHHIHEVKKSGETFEVEWQKSLLKIAEPKKERFMQIDFSATPYNVTGSGQKRIKHYFPHVIVDFDLKTAIRKGLVKTIALDRRKEIASLPLDYKANREGKSVVGLSEGQKMMLRAGLKKLNILEKEFVELTKDKNGVSGKHPKMLVICEDTKVVPYVFDFLTKMEGLSEEDVMEIHSNKKGDVSHQEWDEIKQRLFNVDRHDKPRVIIHVLMLREGFDVNNICVVVPLRPSSSNILLEQTIGRGLRLMWREQEFMEIKEESRIKLLEKKEEPSNYLDILSIVEHPAYIEFYEKMIEEGIVGTVKEDIKTRESVLGDIIKVGLREDFAAYDFYFPIIVQDKEENIISMDLPLDNLEPYPISLEQLKKIVPKDGDVFYSEEITVKTRFGEYSVTADIFNAKSYNEFISRMVKGVTSMIIQVGRKNDKKAFPMMQINSNEIAKLTDNYIRHKLFGEEFDPLSENNWRILLLAEAKVISHIMKNVSKSVYDFQKNVDISEAKVIKRHFSEVSEIKMRENYSIETSKTIYERMSYPSNRGGLEKSFMEFIDSDSKVNAFIKINENYHDFAHIMYIREDGLLSPYYPDFLVKIGDKIFIVETKAEKDVNSQNVKQKRIATIDWAEKINELNPEDRLQSKWHYVLLGENTFYEMSRKGASTEEILQYAKMTKAKIEGTLKDFMSE